MANKVQFIVIDNESEGVGEARNCLSYSFDIMLTILHMTRSQVLWLDISSELIQCTEEWRQHTKL